MHFFLLWNMFVSGRESRWICKSAWFHHGKSIWMQEKAVSCLSTLSEIWAWALSLSNADLAGGTGASECWEFKAEWTKAVTGTLSLSFSNILFRGIDGLWNPTKHRHGMVWEGKSCVLPRLAARSDVQGLTVYRGQVNRTHQSFWIDFKDHFSFLVHGIANNSIVFTFSKSEALGVVSRNNFSIIVWKLAGSKFMVFVLLTRKEPRVWAAHIP